MPLKALIHAGFSMTEAFWRPTQWVRNKSSPLALATAALNSAQLCSQNSFWLFVPSY
jgi:hypothetical protein